MLYPLKIIMIRARNHFSSTKKVYWTIILPKDWALLLMTICRELFLWLQGLSSWLLKIIIFLRFANKFLKTHLKSESSYLLGTISRKWMRAKNFWRTWILSVDVMKARLVFQWPVIIRISQSPNQGSSNRYITKAK